MREGNSTMFYTYVWREANGTPFYVGKGGHDGGKRANNTLARSNEFRAVFASGSCAVEIDDEFILESQAFERETILIAKYGRREFGGLLVNKTDGGEGPSGAVRSVETRKKMSQSARRMTAEHRAKNSESHLGRTRSAEMCANISSAVRRKPPGARNKSGFKGVSFLASKQKWRAAIVIDYKNRHLGYFQNPEVAAEAYDVAALTAFGDDCYLNFKDRVAVDGNVGLASAP